MQRTRGRFAPHIPALLTVYYSHSGGAQHGWQSCATQLPTLTRGAHGSTLSFSRLGAKAAVMRWRNITSDAWQAHDMAITNVALGTITGM